MTSDKRPELTSWKEIADRLQVTVRTAQEWEKKRGLPVRRVPGGRGRVFMLVDELEAWLLGPDVEAEPSASAMTAPREPPSAPDEELVTGVGSITGAGAPVAPPIPHGRSSTRRTASIRAFALSSLVALAALVAGLFAIIRAPAQVRAPAQWTVTEHELIIADEWGDELWRVRFDERLARRPYESDRSAIKPRFVDLDGDGSLELLFVMAPEGRAATYRLICFDAGGRKLWEFEPHADIRTGTERFPDHYWVKNFEIAELSNGARGVVTASIHYMQYPTQIALLAADSGELVAEYWHSGHVGNDVGNLYVRDQNGDGRAEVFAAGISNAYKQATLVVLDAETMRGATTEETAEYQIQGRGPGNEIARILFPRSSLNFAGNEPHNAATSLFLSAELIGVGVVEQFPPPSPSVIYQLRPDFVLDHIVPSSAFQSMLEGMFADRLVARSFDEEMAALRAVRYIGEPGSLIAPH